MRGRGVVLKPVADATLTVNASFTGDGGIVVDGPGTVAFGSGAYAFSGTADVRQGTLDLSSAGTLSDKSFSGDGTIVGATLSSPSIAARLSDDLANTNGVPVFRDCVLSGRVKVLTGRADAIDPAVLGSCEPTAVARLAGTTDVDLGKWRLEKTGLGMARGVFSREGDTVYVKVEPTGAIIIIL